MYIHGLFSCFVIDHMKSKQKTRQTSYMTNDIVDMHEVLNTDILQLNQITS